MQQCHVSVIRIGGAAMLGAFVTQTKTINRIQHLKATSAKSTMIALTKSSIETVDQMINALNDDGTPLFKINEKTASLAAKTQLPAYIRQALTNGNVFTFENCDFTATKLNMGIFASESQFKRPNDCDKLITTSVRVRKTTKKHIYVRGTSTTNANPHLKVKLSARLARNPVSKTGSCPWVDPTDHTKLHPNYIGTIPKQTFWEKPFTIWTKNYRPYAKYDADNNILKFDLWTYSERTVTHHQSQYRWSGTYNSYMGPRGTTEKHPDMSAV